MRSKTDRFARSMTPVRRSKRDTRQPAGRQPRLEPLEVRRMLAYDVSLAGGLLSISEADAGDSGQLDISRSGAVLTIADIGGLLFNAATGSESGLVTNNGTSIQVDVAHVSQISLNAGTGNDALTVNSQDLPGTAPTFRFAGFDFNQLATADQAMFLPGGVLAGGQGVTIDSGHDGAIGPVNFPLDPTGFDASLSVGRLLGLGGGGSLGVNLPAGNNGTQVRSGIEFSWSGGQSLANLPGDDLVIYESSSNPTGPDGFMLQVRVAGGGWSPWVYDMADSRQNYVGSAVEGAFATAYDLSDFGLSEGQQIDALRLANLKAGDRIVGPGVETSPGSGAFVGTGIVIPDDGGATSNVFPDPGPLASFDFYGNSTLDPDPLYAGALHPLNGPQTFNVDVVDIASSSIEMTSGGVVQPPIAYTGFDALRVNTFSAADTIQVDLGGLPTTVVLDAADPPAGDRVVLNGSSGDDTLQLLDNQAVHGGTTITLLDVGGLTIDVSNPGTDDIVQVERSFALSGNSTFLQVLGNASDVDQLVLNTEAGSPASGPPENYSFAGFTFDQLLTPNQYGSLPAAALEGGAITTSPPTTRTSSISEFPDTTVDFLGGLSIGRLFESSSASSSRALNLPAGNNGTNARSGFVVSWDGGRSLTNFTGQDDFVVYESASSSTGVEAFMVQVRDPNTNTWSPWIYRPATAFEPYGGGPDGATATPFNLDDFGIPDGGVIDQIRVVNMTDEDRMVDVSGVGQVLPEDNGATSSFLPAPGTLTTDLTYGSGSLDPDPLYIGVLHSLGMPAGTSDRVVLDPDSVQVDGQLPIHYGGLETLTVNTAGSSDTLLVTPSPDTAYVLNAGDPAIDSNPGDRLILDLAGVNQPLATVTAASAGILTSPTHATTTYTGVDLLDAEPPLAMLVAGGANPNGPAADTFLLQRSGAAIELSVNGQRVARADLEAVSHLTVAGSSDDDTLTVDFSLGNPLPASGLTYQGSGGTNNMVLDEGSFTTVLHTFQSSGAGTIDLDGSTIDYTETADIQDNPAAASRIFVFDTAAGDTIVVDDDLSDADRSRIASDHSATVRFTNPTSSFTLEAGQGGDTVNFQQVDDDFDAAVTLRGQQGADLIRIDSNGPASGGSVDFVTFPIDAEGGGDAGDQLIVEDSDDPTGDLFRISSSLVGGDGIPPGAAVNSAIAPSPVVDGTLSGGEWDQVLPAFDSGARLGPDQQTVLHFPFDEGSGAIAGDSSTNGNDGLLVPIPGPQVRPNAGKFGGALEFDGVDDFAWFQDAGFDVGAAGTLALWFNVDSLGQRQMFAIGPETSGLEFQLRHSNDVYFYTNRNDGEGTLVWSSTLVQPTGVWQHIAYTWDKSLNEGRIYLDGAEVAYRSGYDPNVSGAWLNTINTINQLMNVGYDPLNGRYVDGRMDDLAWYDRALTPAEVTAIANPAGNGVPDGPGTGNGLVAYWTFDGPANQTVETGAGGTTIDLNLTPPPGPVFRPGQGQFGGALEFDGVDDYAFFQDPAFDVGTQGTLSFWVNMHNQGRRNQFFEGPGNSGFEFQYRSNSGGQFFGSPNSGGDYVIQSGGAGGTTGTWTNLQYTWDFASKEMRIYRDGVELTYLSTFNQNIANWTSVVNTIDGMINVGRDPGASDRFFDGLMDDVAWFDSVLTQPQRDAVRTLGVAQAQTNLGGALNPSGSGGNLVAHWDLDDAPGTLTAAGDSGTSIDLIIQEPLDGVAFHPGGGPTLPGSGATLDAVDFDGDQDFIQVADSPSLDFDKHQGTIALWLKPRFNDIDDNLSTGSATLVEDTTEQLELGVSWQANSGLGDLYRRVFFYPNRDVGGNELIVSQSRLAFDQWTHVAVTWDIAGGSTRIFINGQDDGFLLDNTGGITAAGNTGDWILGGDAGFTLDRWFDGEMADVTILNTPLSASEINGLYQTGVQATGPFDLSGAAGRFAWDETNLYGLVESYPPGPGDANGPFSDLQVELFINGSATPALLLDTTLPDNGVTGSVVAGNGPGDFLEFSIPLSAIDDGLTTFDPETDYLQYRVRTIDADVPGSGFDTRDTQLPWVIEPPATSGGLRRMDFVRTEGLFGLGGGLDYTGFETLRVHSGSGEDQVTIDSTHAGTTILNTGGGIDTVLVNGTGSGVTNVQGGDEDDQITVDGTGTGGVNLDGQEGDDDFLIQLGDAPGGAILGVVVIGDTGVNDTDQATIEGGATLADTFLINHFQTVRNATETVRYDTNLEQLFLAGLAGDDTFDVTPSSATELFIDGGPPSQPPGDHLIYNAGGGVANDDGTRITSAGVLPVNYVEIERITLNNADITVTGTGQDDLLEVTAVTPDDGSYVLTSGGVPGPTVSFLNIAGLTFDGLADNDTLRLNNPAGGLFSPARGIVYNGGADDDSLELVGGGNAGVIETYAVGPQNNAGTISFEGATIQTIFFTGLEPIRDNVTVASLAIHASPGDDTIHVLDGPVFEGDQTVDVNFGSVLAPFERIQFANKPHVTINGAAGDDTLNVGYTTASTGLLTMTVQGDGREPVAEVERNNSTAPPPPNPNITSGAQNIDLEGWSTSPHADISLATSLPHLSILGTGDGTFDYYSFVANVGDQGIFDIDDENFNTELFLYDANGNLIAQNDDGPGDSGDGAATASWISHTFASSGTFVIGVARFDSADGGGGIVGNAPQMGDTYTLHVSLQNHGQTAAANPILESEPNDSTPPPMLPGPNPHVASRVQHLDGAGWNLNSNPAIVASTTLPHITIQGTGDGSFDYYSFTAAAGSRVVLDINDANFTGTLFLYDSQGNLVAGGGSVVDTVVADPDTYVVAVGGPGAFNSSGFLGGTAPLPGDTYNLNVSVEGHPQAGDDTIHVQASTPAGVLTQLNGNERQDRFVFSDGAVLTGGIDGGSGVDLVDWSAYTSGRTITLDGLGSVDGFQGRDTTGNGGSSLIGVPGEFDNIDALVGSDAADSLVGPNLRNHWDLGGNVSGFGPFGSEAVILMDSLTDAGVLVADEADLSLVGNASQIGRPTVGNPIAPNAAGESDLAWTGFESLVGAADRDDRFDLRDGAGLSGTLDGRRGDQQGDTLDYRDYTTDVVVDLVTGAATGILGGAAQGIVAGLPAGSPQGGDPADVDSSIENVFGGDGNDQLAGDADQNILGDGFNTGQGVDYLDGREGDDTFRLEPGQIGGGGGSADVLTDVSGSDTVDFRFARAAIMYDADLVGFDQSDVIGGIDLDLPQDVILGETGNRVSLLRVGDLGQTRLMPSPFENIIGSQFNDILDIDPLTIDGNVPQGGPPTFRHVDGNDPPDDAVPPGGAPIPPGDELRFDASGQAVFDTGLSLTAAGLGTVTYRSIETLRSFNSVPRIVDDGDDEFREFITEAGNVSYFSNWNQLGIAGYGGDFRFNFADTQSGDVGGTHFAEWTFHALTPGYYRVAVSHPDPAVSPQLNDVASDAEYTIRDDGRIIATVDVDQRTEANDFFDQGTFWENLGIFQITSRTLQVRLRDAADGIVQADAVRVERVNVPQEGSASTPAAGGGELTVLQGTTPLRDEVGGIRLVTPINRPVTKTFVIRNDGQGPLRIDDIVLAGPVGLTLSKPAGLPGTPLQLVPGGSAFFDVTLSPSLTGVQGDFPGEIRIFSDDFDENVSQNQGVTGIADPLDASRDVDPFRIAIQGVVTNDQIIDDGEPGFSLVGNWEGVTGRTGFRGDDRRTSGGNSGSQAVWAFNNLPDGRYRVSISYEPETDVPSATQVPFTVSTQSGVVRSGTVNQDIAPSQFEDEGVHWNDLGLPIDVTGGTITVRLTDAAGQPARKVIADAVRIERLFEAPTYPDIQVTSGDEVADDTGSIDFGLTFPGAPLFRTFTVTNVGGDGLTVSEPVLLPAGFTLVSFNGTTPPAGDEVVVLNQGESFDFVVRMEAGLPGTLQGLLTLDTNDPDEGPFDFQLKGRIQSSQLIDNLDAQFSNSGGFALFTNSTQGFRGRVHFAAGNPAPPLETANWTFANLAPGRRYLVSASWSPDPNRASDAPYTMSGVVGGPVTVDVNQRSLPNDQEVNGTLFETLGVFTADGGGTLTVQLSDDANGVVVADVVRIAPIDHPELEVEHNGQTLRDGLDALELATTVVGVPVMENLTLRNTGTRPLALGTPVVPSGFSLSGMPSTLEPGQSALVTVQFDAAAAGGAGGALSLPADERDENPFDVLLRANAVSTVADTIVDNSLPDPGFSVSGSFAEINGQGRDGSIHSVANNAPLSTASWAFSGLTPGDTYRVSATWSPFQNRATNAPFTVSGVVGGPVTVPVNQELAPGDYAADGSSWEDLGGPYTVDGGGTITVTLVNVGADEYVVADAVRIEPLADQPEIALADSGANPILDGGGFSFGTVNLGDVVSQTFTITNVGSADLNLDAAGLQASLDQVLGFRLASNFSLNPVPPGMTSSFVVDLDTSRPGDSAATFLLVSNDADESPFEITLSATIAIPSLVVDDGDAGYSEAGAGTPLPVFNGQGFQNDVRQLAPGGGNSAIYTFTVDPLATYEVAASWTAGANRATNAPFTIDGILDGNVLLEVNQQLSPGDLTFNGTQFDVLAVVRTTGNTLTVEIGDDANGFVIADAIRLRQLASHGPEIQLTGSPDVAVGDSLDLGTVAVGGVLQKTFTLTNQGTSDLVLAPSLSLPAGFTLDAVSNPALFDNVNPFVLPADAAPVTFTIGVDTATVGIKSGTVSLGSNDANENPFSFDLSATVALAVQIIDNDDPPGPPGYTDSGNWGLWFGQGFQGDVREALSGGVVETATYTFQTTPGNLYLVSTTYSTFSNRATDATYTIGDVVGGPVNVALNQRLAPNDLVDAGATWENLGSYVAAGNTLTVTLSGSNSGNVIADAVRLELITGPEIELRDGGNSVTSGATVDLGDGLVNTGLTREFTIRNTGPADLILQPLVASGQAVIVSNLMPNQVLPPNDSVTIVVGLDVSTAGVKAGTIQVPSNDGDENPFTLNLTGDSVTSRIIDNDQPGFFSSPSFAFYGGQGFQGSVRAEFSPNGGDTATWTFSDLPANTPLRVSATWSPYFNRATNAQFTITSTVGGGSNAVQVNQQLAPGNASSPVGSSVIDSGGTFADLAAGYVHTGGDLVVTLSDTAANGWIIADAIRVAAPGALRLEADFLSDQRGPVDEPGTVPGARQLPPEQIAPLLAQAFRYWAEAAPGTPLRNDVQVILADLPEPLLGLGSFAAPTIWLDRDAAGFGWRIPGPAGDADSRANVGRVDALTVIAHELGHVLGLPDLDPLAHPGHIMAGRLLPGERRVDSFGGLESRVSLLDGPRAAAVFPADAVLDDGAWAESSPVAREADSVWGELGRRGLAPATSVGNGRAERLGHALLGEGDERYPWLTPAADPQHHQATDAVWARLDEEWPWADEREADWPDA